MLDGEARAGTAGRYAQFVVYRAQVGADSTGAQHKFCSHLRVGHPLCDQAQHVDFALGKPCGVCCFREHDTGILYQARDHSTG